jgi:hypothetical protein
LYSTAIGLLFLLFIQGIRAAQKIRPAPAVFIGIAAAIVYQGFFLIFNR